MDLQWLQRAIIILSSRTIHKKENVETVYIYYVYTLAVYYTGTASISKINSNNNITQDDS